MGLRSAPPLHIGVSVVLAFVAGCVDAIGFAMLGGLFVSFMSGNSTRLGVFLAKGQMLKVVEVLGIIAAFVFGAGWGSLLARSIGRWRQLAVLLTEAAMLAMAAGLSSHRHNGIGTVLMAVAMGVENATFINARGETKINLTFMTGALVKLGEGLAGALLGGPRRGWWPYLLLWAGLTSGAAIGTLGYGSFGVDVLYIVSAIVAATAIGLQVSEARHPAS